jgi:hypothetical protein
LENKRFQLHFESTELPRVLRTELGDEHGRVGNLLTESLFLQTDWGFAHKRSAQVHLAGGLALGSPDLN